MNVLLMIAVISIAMATGCQTTSSKTLTKTQNAIVNVIYYDLDLAGLSKDSVYGSVDAEDARILYAELLEQIPFANTPPEFARAYRAHAKAWRENDKEGIVSTWELVTQSAAAHGIDMEAIETAID